MSHRPVLAPLELPGYSPTFARWLRAAVGRMAPVRALRSRGERQRFERLLVYGLLWAMICTVVELPTILAQGIAATTTLSFALQLLIHFLTIGFGLAIAVFWATSGRGGWLRLASGVVIASVICSAIVAFLTPPLWMDALNDLADDNLRARNETFVLQLGVFTFHSWLALVYGGLAATLYGLRRRIDQMTLTLRSATLARERNEAAIAEARVRAMVERIEPDFLLEVMRAAREHYRTDVSRGESIVNGCVLFLRTAMPQIRSRHSNLAAELDVADAFLTLRSLIGPKALTWHLERRALPVGTGAQDRAERIPLPPLVLLPVLERLIAALAADRIVGPLVIRERCADRDVEVAGIDIDIEVGANSDDHVDPIEADCLEAINQRLVATSGPAAKITVDRSRDLCIVYRLHCPILADQMTGPSIFQQFPRMTRPGEAA